GAIEDRVLHVQAETSLVVDAKGRPVVHKRGAMSEADARAKVGVVAAQVEERAVRPESAIGGDDFGRAVHGYGRLSALFIFSAAAEEVATIQRDHRPGRRAAARVVRKQGGGGDLRFAFRLQERSAWNAGLFEYAFLQIQVRIPADGESGQR